VASGGGGDVGECRQMTARSWMWIARTSGSAMTMDDSRRQLQGSGRRRGHPACMCGAGHDGGSCAWGIKSVSVSVPTPPQLIPSSCTHTHVHTHTRTHAHTWTTRQACVLVWLGMCRAQIWVQFLELRLFDRSACMHRNDDPPLDSITPNPWLDVATHWLAFHMPGGCDDRRD